MSNIFYSINPTNLIDSVLIFVAVFLLLYTIKIAVINYFKKLTRRTQTDIDDLIISIFDSLDKYFFLFISLLVSLKFTDLTEKANSYLSKISIIILVYYGIKIISSFINYGFKKILKNKEEKHEKHDITIIKVINSIVQIILWIAAILIILQNFNFNVSTIIGGLGIGGIAIAFGMQNVLKDIFSFLSILIDKPFKVGDSIEINNTFGTVKQIGIRSTRIKTLTGDELIIPNQDITQKWIRNYKKLKKRRVELNISVTYNTAEIKLKKIPVILENIISGIDKCEFKRSSLKKLADSALIFETVYILNSSSFSEYMIIREKINLGIIKEFKKAKIDFAFPTQTIHLNK